MEDRFAEELGRKRIVVKAPGATRDVEQEFTARAFYLQHQAELALQPAEEIAVDFLQERHLGPAFPTGQR